MQHDLSHACNSNDVKTLTCLHEDGTQPERQAAPPRSCKEVKDTIRLRAAPWPNPTMIIRLQSSPVCTSDKMNSSRRATEARADASSRTQSGEFCKSNQLVHKASSSCGAGRPGLRNRIPSTKRSSLVKTAELTPAARSTLHRTRAR